MKEIELLNKIKELYPKYDWLIDSFQKVDNEKEFSMDIESIEDDGEGYSEDIIINKNIKIEREWYIQSDDEFGLYIYTDYKNNINKFMLYQE